MLRMPGGEERPARLAAEPLDLLDLAQGGGGRLFEKHVEAGVECGPGDGQADRRRSADRDGVELAGHRLQHRLVAGEDRHPLVGRGSRADYSGKLEPRIGGDRRAHAGPWRSCRSRRWRSGSAFGAPASAPDGADGSATARPKRCHGARRSRYERGGEDAAWPINPSRGSSRAKARPAASSISSIGRRGGSRPPTLRLRRDRLERLRSVVAGNEAAFAEAISDDFGVRSRTETELLEIVPTLNAIRHARKHVAGWMRPGAAPGRSPVPAGQRPGAARAARRDRDHLALELSAPARPLAAGRRARRRQPGDGQAVGADPRLLGTAPAPGRGAVRRGGGGGDHRRGRGRPGLRLAALRSSALHRLDRGRPQGLSGRRRQSGAGDARARRQVAGHRLPRLRSRQGGAEHRLRQVRQCRPDLHRARLRAGAGRARSAPSPRR